MSSANIRSIEVLEELRTALMRYKSEAASALNAAAIEIKRTLDWLQERLQYWQNELKRRRRKLEEALAALRVCEALAAAASFASGGNAAPDCSPLQAAVLRARRAVEEAEYQLRMVQEYIKRVDEAVASYQSQARQMAQCLDYDLLKGAEVLSRSTAILLSYASGSPSTSAGSSDTQSVPNFAGVDSATGSSSATGASTSTENAPADWFYADCTHCGGSGNEDIECNACGGKGYRFDGSNCLHCTGGKKAIKCWHCDGSGKILEVDEKERA